MSPPSSFIFGSTNFVFDFLASSFRSLHKKLTTNRQETRKQHAEALGHQIVPAKRNAEVLSHPPPPTLEIETEPEYQPPPVLYSFPPPPIRGSLPSLFTPRFPSLSRPPVSQQSNPFTYQPLSSCRDTRSRPPARRVLYIGPGHPSRHLSTRSTFARRTPTIMSRSSSNVNTQVSPECPKGDQNTPLDLSHGHTPKRTKHNNHHDTLSGPPSLLPECTEGDRSTPIDLSHEHAPQGTNHNNYRNTPSGPSSLSPECPEGDQNTPLDLLHGHTPELTNHNSHHNTPSGPSSFSPECPEGDQSHPLNILHGHTAKQSNHNNYYNAPSGPQIQLQSELSPITESSPPAAAENANLKPVKPVKHPNAPVTPSPLRNVVLPCVASSPPCPQFSSDTNAPSLASRKRSHNPVDPMIASLMEQVRWELAHEPSAASPIKPSNARIPYSQLQINYLQNMLTAPEVPRKNIFGPPCLKKRQAPSNRRKTVRFCLGGRRPRYPINLTDDDLENPNRDQIEQLLESTLNQGWTYFFDVVSELGSEFPSIDAPVRKRKTECVGTLPERLLKKRKLVEKRTSGLACRNLINNVNIIPSTQSFDRSPHTASTCHLDNSKQQQLEQLLEELQGKDWEQFFQVTNELNPDSDTSGTAQKKTKKSAGSLFEPLWHAEASVDHATTRPMASTSETNRPTLPPVFSSSNIEPSHLSVISDISDKAPIRASVPSARELPSFKSVLLPDLSQLERSEQDQDTGEEELLQVLQGAKKLQQGDITHDLLMNYESCESSDSSLAKSNAHTNQQLDQDHAAAIQGALSFAESNSFGFF